MISLTTLKNLFLEYRLPLVCVLFVLILLPVIAYQFTTKNNKNTSKVIQIKRPIDIPQKTLGVKISYTGQKINLPKKISVFTQDSSAINPPQASLYAKALSIEGEPKKLSPGSETYVLTSNNTTLLFSLISPMLEIKKSNIKSGQNNDAASAPQKLMGLLTKLGININAQISKTPDIQNLKQVILDPEKKTPINADFMQLSFSQSIDQLPVITQNPNTHPLRGTFLFGEIQNLEIDLGIQNIPIKGKEEKTIDLSKILKLVEGGGGIFLSADNPEEYAVALGKSKAINYIELKNSQVAYYKNLTDKVEFIPVVLFTGTVKFENQESRNVRIITPLISNYTLTQP